LHGVDSKFRVDIQGSLYPTIRYAYSDCQSLEAAHLIVLKRIQQLVRDRRTAVIYLDGAPAEEKQHAHKARSDARPKALNAANKDVEEFVARVNNNRHVSKQHFVKINKNLDKAFRWDETARQSLALYLRERQWNVVECPTEADVKICPGLPAWRCGRVR